MEREEGLRNVDGDEDIETIEAACPLARVANSLQKMGSFRGSYRVWEGQPGAGSAAVQQAAGLAGGVNGGVGWGQPCAGAAAGQIPAGLAGGVNGCAREGQPGVVLFFS